MNLQPNVKMENISRSFGGVSALDNVDIHVNHGEIVGIIGHNGAGKSTLMKILSGAITADKGSIFINGEKTEIISPIKAHEVGIEMIFQDLALLDNLNAIENFFIGRELIWRFGGLCFNDNIEMKRIAEKSICDINPNFKNFSVEVGRLSGGQRQCISIARAIHMNTKILIMDEPTAALGPAETKMVSELITRLKDKGLSIFLIGHDLEQIKMLSDRIIAMRTGKVVGEVMAADVNEEELLAMIIMGKCPVKSVKGPGATN